MADYKNIKGFNIQYLDSDPPNPIEGQMWFNSATQTLKGAEVGGAPAGTWASGGNMNSARGYQGAAGTQTAALAISGAPTTPTFTYVALVESYNGSSWTEITDVIGARHEASGFGTQTAAIYACGFGPPILTPTNRTDKVESWNGSSWTEVAETNEIKNIMGSGGTATAGIIYGGLVPPTPTLDTANVEYWNGSSWSEENNMNTARSYLAGSGTQTSIIASGGNPVPTNGNKAESWNGTSWTEVSEQNTARAQAASAGTSNTDGLIFGGYTTAIVANTEAWDGSSWTETGDLSTGVRTAGRGPVGTSTSALNFGGQTPGPSSNATEEWNAPPISIKTFTTS